LTSARERLHDTNEIASKSFIKIPSSHLIKHDTSFIEKRFQAVVHRKTFPGRETKLTLMPISGIRVWAP
jgi:hypothetical protein